jgi:tetratricopeptide (TPR) repeat protein
LLQFCLIHTPTIPAKFYWAVGFHLLESLDPSRAIQYLDKAIKLSKLCGHTHLQSNALLDIALHKLKAGEYSVAQNYASEGQHLAHLTGNLYDEARALLAVSKCSMCLGDYQDSIDQLNRAKEIIDICGMSGGFLDHNRTRIQAEVHLLKSEYAQARGIYSQTLKIASVDQNSEAYVYALLNVAQIGVMIGDAAETIQQNLEQAKEILHSLKYVSEVIYCDMILADLHLRQKDTSLASILFRKSLNLGWGLDSEIMSYCLERLADVNEWHGIECRLDTSWSIVYLGFAQKSKEKLALHKALLFLGDVFNLNNDPNTAHTLFIVALEGFTYMDVHRSRAQCMLRLGDLANERGDLAEAVELWNTARPLFECSLQCKDVAKIEARLVAVEEA